MHSQKEKNSLFNQCINEFKSNHGKIVLVTDILNIKNKKDEILNKAEAFSHSITKEPEVYKNIIKDEFALIVSRSVSEENKTSKKELEVKEKFENYIKLFWLREDMKSPIILDTTGWAGADLVITNDRSWLSNRDLVIHTDDARFSIITKELYSLCHEILNYSNKYYFLELIGKVLEKFQKQDLDLVLNKEIFNEITENIKNFINQELENINQYNHKLDYYSDSANYR